jgi:SAM-dependent methyltransferase
VADASRFIADAFLIVLGREVSPIELRDTARGFVASEGERGLAIRLLSSPEFRLLHDALHDGRETGRDPDIEERALVSVGEPRRFVGLAYQLLLGRPADAPGLAHYADAIGRGDSRTSVLRSLILSAEFADHYRRVAPQGGIVPRDVQLCELANPAKWDNPEWVALLRSIGLPDDKQSMHRKAYEFTQLAYGLKTLGFLTEATRIVSIGAGHEAILYWLANQVGRVVATDMYEGVWQDVQSREGDAGVIKTPRDYAPFPYREDRLVFLQMNALGLGLRTGVMDVAYSLSSIEHFGGVEGACRAIDEMARVVRPGGLVAIATEYVIGGPPHEETFAPSEFAALLNRPGSRPSASSIRRSTRATSIQPSTSTATRIKRHTWWSGSTTRCSPPGSCSCGRSDPLSVDLGKTRSEYNLALPCRQKRFLSANAAADCAALSTPSADASPVLSSADPSPATSSRFSTSTTRAATISSRSFATWPKTAIDRSPATTSRASSRARSRPTLAWSRCASTMCGPACGRWRRRS